MGLIALLCMLLTASAVAVDPVSPEVYKYAPLRLIGTNLLDLTPAIKAGLNKKPGFERYRLKGKIIQTLTDGAALVECDLGNSWEVDWKNAIHYASTLELASLAKVQKLIDQNGGSLPMGDYLTLSPQIRTWIGPVHKIENVILKHAGLDPGQVLDLLAWPLPKAGDLREFDFGQKFTGDIQSFPFLLEVTTNSVRVVKIRKTVQPSGAVN